MDHIHKILAKHLWWIVLIIALGLLATHTFSVPHVLVDNTSLILLAIVLASPFIAAIRKIKVGDFEADIQPTEVKRVTKLAEASIPTSVLQSPPSGPVDDSMRAVLDLLDSDYILALAKLRIELELRLRRLHRRTVQGSGTESQRTSSVGILVRELRTQGVLPGDLGNSLLDVIAICNRAIHGEDIRDVDAKRIAHTGVDLLGAVDHILQSHVLLPVQSSVIDAEECEALERARYRLSTVVPYVGAPERRVYELTQEDLDFFLAGYSEVAEFAIRLERIE